MKRKNFIARIVTREGVVWESTPRATYGEAKRWILRLIEEDAPSILAQGIFSIKIIHTPTHTFHAAHYHVSRKVLHVWMPTFGKDELPARG
jgi:hypothetical protein